MSPELEFDGNRQELNIPPLDTTKEQLRCSEQVDQIIWNDVHLGNILRGIGQLFDR